MIWNEIIESIISSSREYDSKTPNQKLIKLFEELGELSQAFLIEQDAAGTAHRDKSEYSVKEELADSFICLISLAETLNVDFGDLQDEIVRKINKWVTKLQREKESRKV